MLGAKALQEFDLLKKSESHASVALKGRPALGPEDIFSQLDSYYAFFTRMPQK